MSRSRGPSQSLKPRQRDKTAPQWGLHPPGTLTSLFPHAQGQDDRTDDIDGGDDPAAVQYAFAVKAGKDHIGTVSLISSCSAQQLFTNDLDQSLLWGPLSPPVKWLSWAYCCFPRLEQAQMNKTL